MPSKTWSMNARRGDISVVSRRKTWERPRQPQDVE